MNSDDQPAGDAPRSTLTRAERSRMNGKKSVGPRTEAGKSRSKYNALKHGMAAKSIVLPGEDRAEFEATRRQFHDRMAPRDIVEALFVDCIVDDAWTFRRTKRAASAQLAHTLRNRPDRQARAEREKVTECSRRLLKDLAARKPLTQADRDGGPGHPARLLEALEATVAGCDWLLERLGQLTMHLYAQGVWRALDGFELLRLLGYHVGELAAEDTVALLLMDSQCLVSESGLGVEASHDPLDDEEDDDEDRVPSAAERWEEVVERLDRKSRLIAQVLELTDSLDDGIDNPRLRRLAPASVDEARHPLALVIDEQVLRLEQVRAERARRGGQRRRSGGPAVFQDRSRRRPGTPLRPLAPPGIDRYARRIL
jgi:hypothetical protein